MTTNNTNTVRLHRVLRAPAERIYRAFLDADAMAKWLPAERIHRQSASPRRQSRQRLSKCPSPISPPATGPFLRRRLPRTETPRTHPLRATNSTTQTCPAKCKTTIILKTGFLRNRFKHHARRYPRHDPRRSLLHGLARNHLIPPRQTRRSRNPRPTVRFPAPPRPSGERVGVRGSRLKSNGVPPHSPCATLPNSASFSTVFQFRAVFVTPIHASNFSAILHLPNPTGVCK